MTQPVTVGIDIGTSSVKAVAADADGTVVASARIPHSFSVPAPLQFEHDARAAWFDGPAAALDALGAVDAVGVSVAAMVPSLTAVDADGIPCAPGLLYGDERGAAARATRSRAESSGASSAGSRRRSRRARLLARAGRRQLRALRRAGDEHDRGGARLPAVQLGRLGRSQRSSRLACALDQMPTLAPSGTAAAEVAGRPGCVLEGGTIDAMGEQIVAGADNDGDVLVICGTTLIVWCVTPELAEVPGYFPMPHTTQGKFLVGGPSNAGGSLPRLGPTPAARRPGPATRSTPAACRCGCRTRAASGRRSTTRPPRAARRPRPHPRPGRGAAGDVRGRGLRHPAHDRGVADARRAGSSRPAAACASTSGCSASPTARACPSTSSRFPKGGALGAAFLARIAAGLETSVADAARWAEGRPHRRARPRVDRPGRRPLRPLPRGRVVTVSPCLRTDRR